MTVGDYKEHRLADPGDLFKDFPAPRCAEYTITTAEGQYLIDIMEPHGSQYNDNVAKAKALADYAAKKSSLARVEMIREMKGAVPGQKTYKRLYMAKSSVRAKVLGIHAPDELDQLFAET